MNKFRALKIRIVRFLFFKTTLRNHFLPIMKFDMSGAQLNSIIENIRDIKQAGSIVEIGVGGGATSVMISQALKYISQERKYICIDNFNGFTNEDISCENKYRGKNNNYLF